VTELETRKKVERLFKYYQEAKQSLGILKFQIANFTGESDEDVIESLNYAMPLGERVSTSTIADKSARIALMYRDVANKQSQELLKGMVRRYLIQKNDIELFEYCITLLEPRLSSIITDMVINKMTWQNTAEKYYVSTRMIGKYRLNAIRQIAQFMDMNTKIG
jgi:hypothetical protein